MDEKETTKRAVDASVSLINGGYDRVTDIGYIKNDGNVKENNEE